MPANDELWARIVMVLTVVLAILFVIWLYTWIHKHQHSEPPARHTGLQPRTLCLTVGGCHLQNPMKSLL